MIEEGGVSANRIVETGGPPWDYEDYLDDDPEVLDRYWRARIAERPSVRIRLVDDRRLFSLCAGGRGLGLAVGVAGVVLRRAPSDPGDEGGEHWLMAERFSPHDLLDVGIGRRRIVAVGAQGGLWLSQDEGLRWQVPSGQTHPPFFDALRAISFSPVGDFGMIVGEHGRILRSLDGGAEWALLASGGG